MSDIIDEVGYWSEIKLEILKEYAKAYSTILAAQNRPKLKHVYIDAFAGSGIHLSKTTNELIPGSPLNALNIKPRFKQYYFIDINKIKCENLISIAKERNEVKVFEGDCNNILIHEIFPNVMFEQYMRGLCLLDPYGLHLDWKVIEKAGKMKSIEIFLNFPLVDMNRNVLWQNPEKVNKKQQQRMTRFWGDDSWKNIAYRTNGNLFGHEEKSPFFQNELIKAFQARLKSVAGFKSVPDPMPMRNNKNAVIYYLFFASRKPVAAEIVADIFKKYKDYKY